MEQRRPNRGARANTHTIHPTNGGSNGNRPFVKLDRITQIPSPFHQNRPSPYSRRMPAGPGGMQLIGSPFQIFSPRSQAQAFPGLPPVPPYPFHNMDLTPRRRQGPMTRSRSASRPQNKQSRLGAKPAPPPQRPLLSRMSLGPKQEKARTAEKPVETKPQAKSVTKAAEKPQERPRRESLRPEPTKRKSLAPEPRRKSLAPVRTDFVERNKVAAGRRKSVDPSTLKDMRTTRRQSLARAVKTNQAEKPAEPEVPVVVVSEPKVEEPKAQVEEVDAVKGADKVASPKKQLDEEAKENIEENGVVSPKRARLEKVESDEENRSPKQTTSLFLQYLDIKKDDLPNIVADFDSQQAASESSKHSKKSRCAIM